MTFFVHLIPWVAKFDMMKFKLFCTFPILSLLVVCKIKECCNFCALLGCIYLLFIIFYWDKGNSSLLFLATQKAKAQQPVKTRHAIFDQNYSGKHQFCFDAEGKNIIDIKTLICKRPSLQSPLSSPTITAAGLNCLNCHKFLFKICIIAWAHSLSLCEDKRNKIKS